MTQAPVTGGCQCGACRYEISGARPPIYACHCLECQRQSASAFGLSMPVERTRISIEGDLACYTRPTDSGSLTDCFFCPKCGVRIYHQSHRNRDILTVKPGTLDATDDIVPIAHLWVSRKQPWVELDPDVPAIATQPEDLAAWRATITGGKDGE